MNNPINFWKPETFEISSFKYNLNERVNKSYKTSGSDNSGLCTYTYNELGFRGESIHKEGFKIMSIGCSHTEGVAINDNETWPSQICSLIPNSVNLNFGTGGRSVDFVVRCLFSFYDLIKPNLVLIMYPNAYRREIYTKINGVEPYMPTQQWGYLAETKDGVKSQECLNYLQNDYDDVINWYKNHLLIKNFLENKKSNWIWNGFTHYKHPLLKQYTSDFIEENRFDGDYGDFIDLGVDKLHPGPKHNHEYSKKLYTHIKNNFPHFLP